MLRNKLVRSDGSIIDSSVIISCEFTEEVNSNTNLSVGDVTASELTVEILSTTPIQQDEVLTYFVIEDGAETEIGVFNAEKPTMATRTTMRFSAYDNVIKTEKLFSDWLRVEENQDLFPMTLLQLVQHACDHAGVTLATTDFPNASLSVNAFYADNITCRQILAWASAIAGRFVRANASGALEFAWYCPDTNINITPTKQDKNSPIVVTDDGNGNVSITSENLEVIDDGLGNVTVTAEDLVVMKNATGVSLAGSIVVPFRRDSLSYETYTTDKIERVQINHGEDDVGVIYPADATGNCFTISENMILGTCEKALVMEVATALFAQLEHITYVPFSVTVPRTIRVRAGDIVSVTNSEGESFISYVMKVSVTPSGTTISATGDKSYESNAAVSSERYENLTGKILSIKKDIDGLRIENKSLDGKVSGLESSVDGFNTFVEKDFGNLKSEVSQTATNVDARFKNVEKDVADIEANINFGEIDTDKDGNPIYGIEVGQRNKAADGTETFNKYARFTSDKLSFYDANNTEVSYIGDYQQVITEAWVKGNLKLGNRDMGNSIVGRYKLDTSNGLALQWVEEQEKEE